MLISPEGTPLIDKAALCFPMEFRMKGFLVVLEADGSCHGQIREMLGVFKTLPRDPNGPLLWLLAAAMSNQLRNDMLRGTPAKSQIGHASIDLVDDIDDTLI